MHDLADRGAQTGADSMESAFFAHPTAVIDEGAEIGSGTKIWHFSHVSARARIGAGCSLGQNVYVANNVRIGDDVNIQNNVSIYERVELEDHVFCEPSMVITNVRTPRSAFPATRATTTRRPGCGGAPASARTRR